MITEKDVINLIAKGWVKNEHGLWVDPVRPSNAYDLNAAVRLQERRTASPREYAQG